MKRLSLILLALAFATSCSKPSQESSSPVDSTAATSGAYPEASPAEERTPITLTAEEADRVGIEIFVWIHGRMIGDGVGYKEDFKIDGNSFEYTALRHNHDYAGMTSETSGGTRQATDEEIKEWEADSSNTEPLTYVTYSELHEYFTPEIDTFSVSGTYIAYLASEPEATPKIITIEMEGTETHESASIVFDGQVSYSPKTYDIGGAFEDYEEPIITIDFSAPLSFVRDLLYVKAKVANLTDADVAGLSKDEMSFVRNDIFARHGHTFKTPKMVEHYSGAKWYHAVITDAASLLNKFEKRNVEFIKKKEG